jgi:hypothetical protein
VALQLNTLFRCFEFHHNRLERLEAAHERYIAIQTKHLQLTLDPIAAQNDGTFCSLQKMITSEITSVQDTKMSLEAERKAAFEGTHDEDRDFLDRKQKAYQLYDYFHEKLQRQDDSEFDINHISDVSDDETIGSSDSHSVKHLDVEARDVTMTDASVVEGEDPTSSQQEGQITASPPTDVPQTSRPQSWDSDEEWEPHSSLHTQQPWTKTPPGAKQREKASNTTKRLLDSTRPSVKKFLSQAFAPRSTNRFSVLSDDPPASSMATTPSYSEPPTQGPSMDDDDPPYVPETSDDDSLENMSIVSNSELHDLAAETEHLEDGYETDTTDNTSPKKSKRPKRKSSTFARERLSEFYLSIQDHNNPAPTDPAPPSPHPLRNTTSSSKGHGASST